MSDAFCPPATEGAKNYTCFIFYCIVEDGNFDKKIVPLLAKAGSEVKRKINAIY